MPRHTLLTLLALALFAAPAIAAPAFPDKNLDAAVRAALLDPKGDLTDEMLKNLSYLNASGKGIKDLTGLEKCKGLAELDLSKNQIVDLKALKDLTNIQSL